MSEFEVHLSLGSGTRRIGRAISNRTRGKETVIFEYAADWLRDGERFELAPELPLTGGAFVPPAGLAIHGALGDSAPDTWGRRLMQRAERRQAEIEGRSVRTLMESDYLLGVCDETRLGALRFCRADGKDFLSKSPRAIPPLVKLGRLLQSSDRILRDEETDEDLQLIFAPGSSLGGARPKASVLDRKGCLSIAKFPKESDEYSIETWESVALRLAERAGIVTAGHDLLEVARRAVLLSRRFDRADGIRIPFVSAMAMLGARDGETGSYLEMVDALARHGARAKKDTQELYRRVAFNVLASNVDDHMRNHGFLRIDRRGWTLAPAYDLNPVPADLKARVLSTNITLDDGTCSIDLLEASAESFSLSLTEARRILKEVALATSSWRVVAREAGASAKEIHRMASAFEHDALRQALALP
jgi:serine/threonine-protein kinase HipA